MTNLRGSFFALALSLVPAIGSAEIHKCVGADGKRVFSDQPCTATQRTEGVTAKARAPTQAAAASSAAREGPWGLSFAMAADSPSTPTPVHLSCHGEPAAVDHPHRGSCNPYSGDTSCRASLPIACMKPTGASAPDKLQQDFYSGWVKGDLGATRPVAGTTLKSADAASAVCRAELGAGWRMAEFHDGGGGWGLQGERGAGLRAGTRYWVHINDQRGNCWDAAP